ncbi:MAG: outer membrane protein transport protein [bacterium]|nr:outer membrane protein transport protein [bacterium]
MKRNFTILLVAAAMLMLAAGPAMAAGFRIPEAGAKAMGLSNAFVGQADDPSAVQLNPAGLTQVEGNQVLTGITAITTSNSYADTGGTSSDANRGNFFPPHFYYSNHLGEGQWWLGLGMTVPFGLGTDWEVDSFSRIVTKTNLEMIKLNPVMAYKASDSMSLAFGVDYYHVLTASFANEATVINQLDDGYQELEGDGAGFGFNVGMLYTASDDLSIGFAYRTGTTIEVEGEIDVTADITGSSVTGYPVPAKVDLNLPATAALGLSYRTSDKLRLNFDVDWTGWSAYDELKIKHADLGVVLSLAPKDYDDTIAYRVGAEYELTEKWDLRGGFLLDTSPVPEETYDPRLPDGDRWGVSIGAGYTRDAWTIDMAYMFVNLDKESIVNSITDSGGTQNVNGDYEGDINLIGLSVGYAF